MTAGESPTAGAPGAGDENRTESGLPFASLYGPDTLAGFDAATSLGKPGEYPFTRGVYPSMYTGRPWTMRQYAGFGTAVESNARYKQLVANGTGGLSVAFDLPTQMGHDSDAAIASGEVGKVGVAIDSIDDMRLLFDGLPLDQVSTSMTINAPAALLLLMYQLVAEENGVPGDQITGTIQNDVLKEYIARGTYIYPPQESLRLITDIFAYCKAEVPRWNTISISGYHMAEAGATPAQEIAFTLADGIEYVRAAVTAGLDVDDFAARLSFFFVSRTTILEEVAKFRAARRIWAQVMRDEFGAKNPKSQMLRFHTQTAGVQLTAQQPEVNLVRVAIQGLAAVLGGTQSLHTNSFDEAIALPSEKAARLALRTQQVIAYESDVTKTVDPFAGSYAIESLTDDVEAEARRLMEQVEELGGAVAAIEKGFQKNEIEKAAYQIARDIDSDERVVVGVNRFTVDEEEPYEPLRVDPAIEEQQCGPARDPARRARPGRGRPAPRRDGRGSEGHRERALPDAARRCAPGPPSARSATRCARSGACTLPRTRSEHSTLGGPDMKRLTVAGAALAAGTVLVAGCSNGAEEPTLKPQESPSASASATPSPTASASPAAEFDDVGHRAIAGKITVEGAQRRAVAQAWIDYWQVRLDFYFAAEADPARLGEVASGDAAGEVLSYVSTLRSDKQHVDGDLRLGVSRVRIQGDRATLKSCGENRTTDRLANGKRAEPLTPFYQFDGQLTRVSKAPGG